MTNRCYTLWQVFPESSEKPWINVGFMWAVSEAEAIDQFDNLGFRRGGYGSYYLVTVSGV